MALANKDLIDPKTNTINLSKWQEDFVFNESRYKIACCGRRSGKSTAACVLAYATAVSTPKQIIWAVATTYGQAKKLYFKPLQDIIPKQWIRSVNKTDLTIELINGSMIELKGANNFDALLGDSIDLLILDEYQSQSPEVLDYLTPMLADRQGKMVVVGTPRGYNHFYDLWSRGIKGNPDFTPNFYSVQIKTIDAETIPQEEIEDAKNRMTTSMFEQEFNASFESITGLVYKEFSIVDNMNTSVSIRADEHLLIGMDFNVEPMTAVIGVMRDGNLYIVDEVYLHDSQTKDMCQYIKSMYPTNPITVFPDPAGNSRTTTGNTNHQIIAQHGFKINAFRSHPRIEDRVNCVNILFLNARGVRRLFINPRCYNLLKTLKGLIYDEATNQPSKRTGLDHMSDALGYLVARLFPIEGTTKQFNII